MTLSLVAAGGVILLLLVMFWFARKAGKDAAENDQLTDTLDALEKARKARDSLSDPAVRDELRQKYRR